LFGSKSADDYLLLWTLPSKQSYWFRNIGQASLKAQVLAQSEDVYVGVGLSPVSHGPKNRCPAEQIAGLAGLWADIDIADPVHKKEKLPPTIEAAVELVNSMPFSPSLIVHSGHGLQAWWLFDEIWDLRKGKERERAQRLSQQWSNELRRISKDLGYECDSVFDLARILRIPGTTNRKSEVVDVRVLSENDTRFSVDEIANSVKDVKAEAPAKTAKEYEVQELGGLILDSKAQVNEEMLLTTFEMEPRFVASYNRKPRRELTDNSPNGHDLALATFAAMYGWEDQQIVNLLIQVRRENGEKIEKALRKDYIASTLGKAKEAAAKHMLEDSPDGILNEDGDTDDGSEDGAGRGDAESYTDADSGEDGRDHHVREAEHRVEAGSDTATTHREDGVGSSGVRSTENTGSTGKAKKQPAPTPKHIDEKTRQGWLDSASKLIGFEVIRVLKFSGENPSYQITTEHGSTLFTGIEAVQNQNTFRNKFSARANKNMQRFKQGVWDRITNCILNAAEETNIGEESTVHGMVKAWIASYLSSHTLQDDFDIDRDSPYIEGEYVCLYSDHFRKWMKIIYGENIKYQELGMYMRIVHCIPSTIEVKLSNGKWTDRNLWKVPAKEFNKVATEAKSDHETP